MPFSENLRKLGERYQYDSHYFPETCGNLSVVVRGKKRTIFGLRDFAHKKLWFPTGFYENSVTECHIFSGILVKLIIRVFDIKFCPFPEIAADLQFF